MSTSKILLCVLGAAAAGAVVANLVTSGKGSDLVDRIRNVAGDLLTKLKEEGSSFARGTTAEQGAEFNQANTPPNQA